MIKKSNLLFRLLLLLLVNILIFGGILLLAEFYFRIFNPQVLRQDARGAFIRGETFHHHKPGFDRPVGNLLKTVRWTINKKGLRGPEKPYQKAPHIYRIAGIGDSFSFGVTVEYQDSFLRVLEEELNKQTKNQLNNNLITKEYEVINMGVAGYGTIAEYELYRDEGILYQPDLVLLSVFVGNDFEDVIVENKLLKDINKDHLLKLSSMRKLTHLMGSHFHTYSFLSKRLNTLLIKLGLRNIHHTTIEILEKKISEKTAERWNLFLEYLLKFKKLTIEHQQQLVIVIIPISHQVYSEEWNFVIETYDLNATFFDLDKPQKRIAQFCKENDILYLDLLPFFRNYPERLYNPYGEWHFNPKGHRITAKTIFQFLTNDYKLDAINHETQF